MSAFRNGDCSVPHKDHLGVGSTIENIVIIRLKEKVIGLMNKDFEVIGSPLTVIDTNHLSKEEYHSLCKMIEPQWTSSDFSYKTEKSEFK